MSELIAALVDAVHGGTVPRPAPQEQIEEYAFRCAHAGAMVALAWAARPPAREPVDVPVADGGATVTPPVVIPESVAEPVVLYPTVNDAEACRA